MLIESFFGEGSIRLTKTKKNKASLRSLRLGFKIIVMSISSLLIAVVVYYLYSALGNYIAETKTFQSYFEQGSIESSTAEFHKYISDNNINSGDYSEIKLWLTDNRRVGFLFDNAKTVESEYTLHFADKEVPVMLYISIPFIRE